MATLTIPTNPLLKKYPPSQIPQHSQVCDGYSCMWCGRCPNGDYWQCPEEDKAIETEYLSALEDSMGDSIEFDGKEYRIKNG